VWKTGAMGPGGGTFPEGVFEKDARLTMALPNLIQSTSAVVDLFSGDLLERGTFLPNGARETLRANSEVEAFQLEPVGFTGKEADSEVGLVYFGERYLMPHLGRWASADPLQVHGGGGGEFGNSFQYVSGSLLQARDVAGLSIQLIGDNPAEIQKNFQTLQSLTNQTLEIDDEGNVRIVGGWDPKRGGRSGTRLINRMIMDKDHLHRIRQAGEGEYGSQRTNPTGSNANENSRTPGVGSDTLITIKPSNRSRDLVRDPGSDATRFAEIDERYAFAHELVHADRMARGVSQLPDDPTENMVERSLLLPDDTLDTEIVPRDELETTGFSGSATDLSTGARVRARVHAAGSENISENDIRRDEGGPIRVGYSSRAEPAQPDPRSGPPKD